MNRVVSYSVGLLLALVLTVASFTLVFAHTSHAAGALALGLLVPIIIMLAFVQLAVQLVFFLHLGLSKEARWNTAMFVITFSGILVIISASIWIMAHLNYNMTPAQQNQYIIDQSSF